MVQLVTTLLGLLAAGVILLLMRNDKLHAHLGLAWVLVAVGFALLGMAPGVFDHIARYFGINYPPVLALTLAVILLVIKILIMDIERSHVETHNQRLIQRVAMLETELRRLESVMKEHLRQPEENRSTGNPGAPAPPADDS